MQGTFELFEGQLQDQECDRGQHKDGFLGKQTMRMGGGRSWLNIMSTRSERIKFIHHLISALYSK
jgi:hypothetical protein